MKGRFKWDVTGFDDWAVDDYPIGAVCLESGNSVQYVTGGWRSFRPVWDGQKCTHCMLCWVHCPDSSISVAGKKMTGIDYEHCKGCGVCVKECAHGALRMVDEASAAGASAAGASAVGASAVGASAAETKGVRNA
jgi:pyruvate ferredoxin oxidoreductase delta subunit